jgi:hypothetical protein
MQVREADRVGGRELRLSWWLGFTWCVRHAPSFSVVIQIPNHTTRLKKCSHITSYVFCVLHLQAYFLRARGPALHTVLTRFMALYVLPLSPVTPPSSSQPSPDPAAVTSTATPTTTPTTATTTTTPTPTATTATAAATATATACALSLQQCQQLNRDLKARVETLSTENSALTETLEDKTDKALDAWAVAHEKYTALEEITRGMHVQMAGQEELIEKLKRRLHEVSQRVVWCGVV